MVQQQESVVTPERFDSGLTYEQYLNQIEKNKARFEENYERTEVASEQAYRLKALASKPGGPKKMLVLGEDWCPDVYRGLPVLARIAEAAGLEMRVFPRDQHLDIMNEFLNQGEFQSIPTAVFYTGDHRYIAHFSERPRKANDEMPLLMEKMQGLEGDARRDAFIEFQNGPTWAGWRPATIEEIIELLEANVRD